MKKRKYTNLVEEVCLGIQKIRSVGGVSVITVPKEVSKKHNLTIGDSVLAFLIVRKRKLLGELEEGEEWVKMTKEDRIKYQLFCKQEKDLLSVTNSL